MHFSEKNVFFHFQIVNLFSENGHSWASRMSKTENLFTDLEILRKNMLYGFLYLKRIYYIKKLLKEK